MPWYHLALVAFLRPSFCALAGAPGRLLAGFPCFVRHLAGDFDGRFTTEALRR